MTFQTIRMILDAISMAIYLQEKTYPLMVVLMLMLKVMGRLQPHTMIVAAILSLSLQAVVTVALPQRASQKL
jgi:hypothetical protein